MGMRRIDERQNKGYEVQWYDKDGNNADVMQIDTAEELAQYLARSCWSELAFKQNPTVWKDGKKWCLSEYTPVENPEAKAVVELDDGCRIVAEKNVDNDYKEIFVYLTDESGFITQDLAIVGEKYTYDNDNRIKSVQDKYSVKVYGDAEDEDWTKEFIVDRYRYEEA